MEERTRPLGRPRSEDARLAVLRAVDDMLVEEGYAAMTMKGIAERAKVGRQTVYRWWSSKAEILLEASATDAARELTVEPGASAAADVAAFLTALSKFLTSSDAGLAYRALLGEAQHDHKVAELLRGTDVLGDAARAFIADLRDRGALGSRTPGVGVAAQTGVGVGAGSDAELAAELVGPTLFRTLVEGWAGEPAGIREMATRFLAR
ncbi:TetR/AcrR family transcriptional regulator [Leucobacter komagatae]|uniref:TetR family transcriptional regulator n=1 Tax=Leucobacter komagatae TaxID=55969 RepID=A0A0D0H7T5_9MICO|nr:TetR/AcrR family transcriptional regulator [Leucobacter komagatae]KIP53285.1 TetR family transcriptional regulator [Leucobacter komagatae]